MNQLFLVLVLETLACGIVGAGGGVGVGVDSDLESSSVLDLANDRYHPPRSSLVLSTLSLTSNSPSGNPDAGTNRGAGPNFARLNARFLQVHFAVVDLRMKHYAGRCLQDEKLQLQV